MQHGSDGEENAILRDSAAALAERGDADKVTGLEDALEDTEELVWDAAKVAISRIAKSKKARTLEGSLQMAGPGDTEGPLPIGQRLEALQANIINGILSADISRLYEIALSNNQIARKTWFDAGVIRACQHGAILALARIVDKHRDAASITKFLNCAEQSPGDFQHASPDDVKKSIKEHRDYITNHALISKIEIFRDKALAHTDPRAVKDPSIMMSALFDMAEIEELLDEIYKIVNVYSEYHDGSCLLMDMMREDAKENFWKYINLRQDEIKRNLDGLERYRRQVEESAHTPDGAP